MYLHKYYYMQVTENISSFPKIYLACSIAFSFLVFSKSLDPYAISYTFTQTFMELSLWRPITAIFYLSRVNFLFPVHIAFAWLATSKISGKVYQRQTTADLVWLMLFSVIGLMVFSTFVNLYFYGSSFVMIMLLMWAMQYPVDTISIGRAEIHSVYLPIIYPVVMIALGSSYKNYMVGLLLGIIYGTLKNPSFIREHGDYLPTPGFIKSFFRFDVYDMERRRIEEVRGNQRDSLFQGRAYHLN